MGLVGEKGDEAHAGGFQAVPGDELGHDVVEGVDGDGEADAHGGPRGSGDGGVHAHQAAGAVEERAAGIAGVHCGVCLDGVQDPRVVARVDPPAQGGDDALGQRVVQAEGVADGHDGLAHLQVVAAADGDGPHGFQGREDLEHGDVEGEAGADDPALVGLPVRQRDLHLVHIADPPSALLHGDDMVVGDHMAPLVPDKPGARARGNLGDVQRPRVLRGGDGRDIDHAGLGLLEAPDRVLLLGPQRRPLGHDAGFRVGPEALDRRILRGGGFGRFLGPEEGAQEEEGAGQADHGGSLRDYAALPLSVPSRR